ncbi:hypothetical protein K461DRAFT_326953 [Myriangium duriaei CBS 260.36]|uniref:histidine kinase n=1 Tax=Myriangium duriaei CBS 260.36 TaxID=1168546 RepID=A0A9P4MQ34_9PEZI|nr:hypothetical protein K461DRAFT_326953 [Myriangium duriaei CBS 260.36]
MAAKAYFPVRSSSLGLMGKQIPTGKPGSIGPVFDPEGCAIPIPAFDPNHVACTLPESLSGDVVVTCPPVPEGFKETDYLYPSLTRNEFLRLNTLWYHTRHALEDGDLLANLQIKVDLVREFLDWEFAICGILDNNTYTRVASSGIALAVLPRRESTCSHTVQTVDSGRVFQVADMSDDWRFKASPHVDKGGIRSYAGTSLRCQVETGESIALGSLCVASNTPGKALSASQQSTLVRFANMLSNEIVDRSRAMRREQQQYMHELLSSVTANSEIDAMETRTFGILHEIYAHATIGLRDTRAQSVALPDGQLVPLSDFHSGVWEDSQSIDTLIITQNQSEIISTRFVRALIGVLRAQTEAKALVVASTDVRLVFDDIDAWFVDRCSAILNHVAQERSLTEARIAKERFLRGITHQLRTPIHGVLGSVDLLVEELASKDLLNPSAQSYDARDDTDEDVTNHTHADAFKTVDVLRTIQNSGRELMSTVNNILRLNRWGELVNADGAAVIHDLANLEETLLEDTRKLLPDSEVDRLCIYFDNQLPPNTSTTMLDTDLVKECLQSLILNSFQFTRMGCLIVSMTCTEDCSTIAFDVQDTGRGIRPENHGRIFEEYEKEDVHSRGAGLGLTLASKIASAMSGSVELISSTPDKGSQFCLSFKNPRLGCRIDFPQSQRTIESWKSLKTFTTFPAKVPTLTVKHFTQYLRRCGLKESPSSQHSNLTVVTYIPIPSMFVDCLAEAKTITGVAVCLVPGMENVDKLQQKHPNILFFNGPFTSKRLQEIMTKLDLASAHVNSIRDQSPESLRLTLSDRPRTIVPKESMTSIKQARMKGIPNALLVDDNVINLRIVRMYCDKRSYPYRTAMDGLEAIAQYKEALEQGAPISLILLDLQMPNCDGIEACEEIRKIEKEKDLTPAVIFIVTGQDSLKDRTRAFEAGANEFYVKPMSLKTLDRGIAQYFKAPN